MYKENKLPESLLKFIACRPGAQLHKIRSEASQRRFFRISWKKQTCVAMVYPEKSPNEVSRFLNLRDSYEKNGLRVPGLIEVLDDQVLILEDVGDLLLQKAWRERVCSERQCLLAQCADILKKLAVVPPQMTKNRLDSTRLLWEMDFFQQHFSSRFPGAGQNSETLRVGLIGLVENIDPESTFAHRDFHSRNLLVNGGEIVMVDFQDSLLAPRYYDLVSLAYDSYLDLGRAREILLSGREWKENERRQMRLTALQRNIKALGTFAYQVHERGYAVYGKYIPRTLRHIQGHLRELADPGLEVLSKYFLSLLYGRV
jgi:aminoglycoside/choline kinase family phosphotransferase